MYFLALFLLQISKRVRTREREKEIEIVYMYMYIYTRPIFNLKMENDESANVCISGSSKIRPMGPAKTYRSNYFR